MQEAARSRYNDVLDFDSLSAILKIEWREEDLGFSAHVQPFLSPVTSGAIIGDGDRKRGLHAAPSKKTKVLFLEKIAPPSMS